MKQTYKVFTTAEIKKNGAKYFEECQQNEIVHLTAIKKRKFTTVSWDIITLNNPKQMVADSTKCSLNDDIYKLYEKYKKDVNFKKSESSHVITTTNGFIYIYNEDIKKVLPSMCKLIDNMIESNCLVYTTPQERYKDVPDNLKKYFPPNLGL